MTIITNGADIEVPRFTPKPSFAVPYVRNRFGSATAFEVPAVSLVLKTDEERAWDSKLTGLRALKDQLLPFVGYNDQVLTLIDACIGTGINTRKDIRTAMEILGYKAGSVMAKLNYETGKTADCRYERDGNGIYSIR